ncbi:hypothetical protein [Actinopolyspora halophila]|uniref:hypothetical protein n=1 Tax=Actinopolyspora halophila TaxID=1850 RepID=UPI000369002B|nr:hypothetical protein [Actinopolyspora halophila]
MPANEPGKVYIHTIPCQDGGSYARLPDLITWVDHIHCTNDGAEVLKKFIVQEMSLMNFEQELDDIEL